ncbi:PIN domain-containing protein [Polynucleobacter sp. Fuers-14]|uniref:PIN domain-containing protein n=1 Tax=Polynucleobacter sp. Fuers-14 TaxID=1758364 RepID=UPI0027E35F28|nr:PIN domain-containing protein [Polynucleobacter sp. Fuers-14]
MPDWEITEVAWNSIAGSLNLPDLNDVHVLAAAIAGHADCIVTRNHQDFPPSIMAIHGIDILDPDEFIVNQWDLENVPVMAAFKGMREKKRTETVEDFAQTLEKNGLPATAQKIREAAALI